LTSIPAARAAMPDVASAMDAAHARRQMVWDGMAAFEGPATSVAAMQPH
jgi:hypothetical protein